MTNQGYEGLSKAHINMDKIRLMAIEIQNTLQSILKILNKVGSLFAYIPEDLIYFYSVIRIYVDNLESQFWCSSTSVSECIFDKRIIFCALN